MAIADILASSNGVGGYELDELDEAKARMAAELGRDDLVAYRAKGAVVVCKPLTGPEAEACIAASSREHKGEGRRPTDGPRRAFHYCCVYPKQDELRKLLARLPLLPVSIGNLLVEAAGLADASEVEKR